LSDLTYDAVATPPVATPDDLTEVSAPAPTPAWSFATRLGFRAAFCYCLLYALCCGNATLWEIIPFGAGDHIGDWLAWPFRHGAEWIGQHWLHLTGVGAKLHGGGSGDRALDWTAMFLMMAVALVATVIWTASDELRSTPARAYPRLFFWMRFVLRLALGYAMLNYGMVKLFPLQMAPPSLAVLNEPLGNTSPMTMLWTLIGLNPYYEMICGAAEVLGGALLLFRRTALVGTLLTAFLTTNIVLYNFCFDVPVKIYAAHLLLISLVLLAPSVESLWAYFILHRPTVPVDRWTRPARRFGLRVETVVTAVVLLLVAGMGAFDLGQGYFKQQAGIAHPSPWVGQWHVDAATVNGQPKPFLTGDGLPMTDVFVEPSGRTMLRDTATVLWRAGVRVDDKKHTVRIGSAFMDHPIAYAMAQPDATHMILTPTDKDAKTASVLALRRVPLPSHYPLLERGFHFVNEWGLER
jgi:hypothetical protein